SSARVRAYEGVTVPRGTRYRFKADEAHGNLVMFRVGAALVKDSSDLHPKFGIPNEAMQSRSDTQGRHAAGDARRNGVAARPTIFKAGAYFAADNDYPGVWHVSSTIPAGLRCRAGRLRRAPVFRAVISNPPDHALGPVRGGRQCRPD